MSYLEIYQDKALDLLIHEDEDKNIIIPKLMQCAICKQHFIPASQNHTAANTKLNHSSCSVLLLQGNEVNPSLPFQQLTGKLYQTDLASLEDNQQVGNLGTWLKESSDMILSLFGPHQEGGHPEPVTAQSLLPGKQAHQTAAGFPWRLFLQ
nr:PREDICTED: kinesin-like protein KIF22-A [Latimeria chalumnae]|eukprot:XP_014344874.1 PREDICTED: kinesin-like protein KIF22-A [Latimeria chalumnae]